MRRRYLRYARRAVAISRTASIVARPKREMASWSDATDHEALFRLIYDRRWAEVLAFVHGHREAVARDALLTQAVDTFAAAFLREVEAAGPEAVAPELERLFLLHAGGFYRLAPGHYAQVVAALVSLNAARPEAALGYARLCPDHPACAAFLRAHDAPPPARVAHAGQETLDLARSRPEAGVDHTVSLFKSQQELDFFMAVREVFATYFVYPNVALSCLVDYESVRERLSAAERRYFFRAQVDCVVFDQHGGYRPRYFFELDSPLHDTDARQARDRAKERILAVAGQSLHRIRPRARRGGRAAFVTLLKEVAAAA